MRSLRLLVCAGVGPWWARRWPAWPGRGCWALQLAAGLFATACAGPAASWTEDFSSDPLARRWRVFGEPSLFAWNAAEAALAVTWDSRKPNSYFFHPLDTVVAQGDDFELAFDLRMQDITPGVDPLKPYTFQLAVGLIRLADATGTNFFRGAGINATWGPRNLVEFDFFPDTGYGATFAPTVISTNNRIVFSDNHPLELTLGARFRIAMSYNASQKVLRTAAWRDGEPFGLPPANQLNDLSLAGFPDFRVDTVAICSYNDGHQTSATFAGSILAHGQVDNISVVVPAAPVQGLRGQVTNQVWQASFEGRTGWVYRLQRTVDFAAWSVVSPPLAGKAGLSLLSDTNIPPATRGFYRISAERP